jgi:8-oxo-dGTP pyrophosphatase MutT (NUDIX family)
MERAPDWMFQQSGVIAHRRAGGKTEVLLIPSRKRKRWVIPKGIIEPFMSAAESAAKEAWEEAGVRGEVDEASLGTYEYTKWGGVCTVEVYPMAVTEELDEWPECEVRERNWVSCGKAAELVDEPELKTLLRRFGRNASASAREGQA